MPKPAFPLPLKGRTCKKDGGRGVPSPWPLVKNHFQASLARGSIQGTCQAFNIVLLPHPFISEFYSIFKSIDLFPTIEDISLHLYLKHETILIYSFCLYKGNVYF